MSDQAQNLRDMMNKLKEDVKPESSGTTRIITVASGKGGVGKSCFSLNLSVALSKLRSRVLLIDADFGLANINVMLGKTPEYNLSSLLKNVDIKEIIQDDINGIKFISGGSGVYDLINLNESQLKIILKNLLQLESMADIIIFDAGAGISDNIMRLVRSSDEMIIVTTPEPTSIMDAYALIKTVCSNVEHPVIKVVMNKSESVQEAQATLESLVNIVFKYMKVKIEPLGYILFDKSVTSSVKMQTPLINSFPKSVASQNITAIAERCLGITSQTGDKGGLRSFINKFFAKRA